MFSPLLTLAISFVETQNALVLLLRDVAQRHSQEFQGAVMSLPAEQRTKMTAVVAQS